MAVCPPCRRQSFTLYYFAGPSSQSSFEKLPRDNRSGPPLDARRRAASTSRQKRRRRSPSRQSSWAKQSRMEAFRRCLRQSPATFGEIPTSTWIVVDWPMIDRFADVALDEDRKSTRLNSSH